MSLIADFERLMKPADDVSPQCVAQTRPGARELPVGEHESAVAALLRASHSALVNELIARIHAHTPEFFEQLVIDVLVKMGYGKGRGEAAHRLGRSGDGGIDGVVAADELGLDLIYVQAKRLKPGSPVPITDVRDFAGSLEARHAIKGVFVTTTHFSPGAVEFCSQISRRVVLIDGRRLAELMVTYDIGVAVRRSYHLKGVDASYFRSR